MKRRTGYLMKRGKVYYACWTMHGKKFVQSTGKRDKDEAETELRRIMEPVALGNEVTTLQNIAAKIGGRTAELARLDEEAHPPLTVNATWTAYVTAGNRKEISEGTKRNYATYWQMFDAWITEKHPEIKALRDVSFEICEEYKTYLISPRQIQVTTDKGKKKTKTIPPMTGRTFNAHRAFLRACFSVVAEKAKMTGNPWAKIAKRDENSLSRRPLTVEELRTVCQSAKGELRVMLAFGFYLGARLGDAACMTWGNVDMIRREIRFIPRKTARKKKDPMTVPMNPELFAILSETPPADRKGPVCPTMADLYTRRGADGVSGLVQDHFEACGIETTSKRDGAGIRPAVAVGFHSLRHTAVSLMRDAGAAQSISQAIVGHNSREVHQLYTHADEAALRRAVGTLPNVIHDAPALPAKREPMPPWVREGLAAMTPENWQALRDEMMKADKPEKGGNKE
jgi:integrase